MVFGEFPGGFSATCLWHISKSSKIDSLEINGVWELECCGRRDPVVKANNVPKRHISRTLFR